MGNQREKTIVRTSIIGIAANVALAAFKAVIGVMSNSIAITLDAVNNLSDAMSSVITILGAKIAGRVPDKKHPYGLGRVEYLSAAIISLIVLYAGITSLTESVKKIIHPETPEYSKISLVIVGVAVLVKIILGRYVKSVGQKVESDSLVNSGEDAILDSVISASTLLAAILYLTVGLKLESYLGAVISVVIIKSGIEMLRDTISQILGERVESNLAKEIKQTICEHPDVFGAYDLILHDYGPDRMVGSVHVEVPDYYTAKQIDEMTRLVTDQVLEKFHIYLTAIGIYSMNTSNDKAAQTRDNIREIVMRHDEVLQMHGFFIDEERRSIRFDVVIDFAAKNRQETYAEIVQDVQRAYPEYEVQITLDADITD